MLFDIHGGPMRGGLLAGLWLATLAGCGSGSRARAPSAPRTSEATAPAERDQVGAAGPAALPACGDAAACHQACSDGAASACVSLARMFEAAGRAAPAALRFRRACELGDAAACGAAAVLHARAGADSFDVARAAELFARGCDGGDAPSCAELSHWYEVGREVAPSTRRAAELTRRARWLYELRCDAGDGAACHELGLVRRRGADLTSLVSAFQRACELGVADDCGFVGRMHQHLGRPAAALRAFVAGCDAGDPWSCEEAAQKLEAAGPGAVVPGAARRTAASLRYHGEVLRRRARAALTGRCDAGDAGACERVALDYENQAAQPARRVGRRLLYARARGLWLAHCESSGGAACHDGARLLREGLGGPADAARATQLSRRACATGVGAACAAEARALLLAAQTVADPDADARANDAFQRGCDLGDAEACRELGWRVLYGLGTAASPPGAEKLLTRACELGSDDACQPTP